MAARPPGTPPHLRRPGPLPPHSRRPPRHHPTHARSRHSHNPKRRPMVTGQLFPRHRYHDAYANRRKAPCYHRHSVPPQIEQNIHRKRAPVLNGDSIEPAYSIVSLLDELQNVGTGKTRVRIVVSRVAFTLHTNEQSAKTLYSLRESVQHILPGTTTAGGPVFQGAVGLTPCPLAPIGGRHPNERISATASQSMEQRVVGATHGSAQFRLTRPTYPVMQFPGRQVQGDSYQVTRIYHICLRTPPPSPTSPRTTCWADS